jgi:hypothetical protein
MAMARSREKEIGDSRGSLEPPGPLNTHLLTHLHAVYMAYSECLPTRLNPLAERTCFSQARSSLGRAAPRRTGRVFRICCRRACRCGRCPRARQSYGFHAIEVGCDSILPLSVAVIVAQSLQPKIHRVDPESGQV